MPTKKTSMYFTEEDQKKIEEIKRLITVTKDVQAVRYAIHHYQSPKKK